MKKGFTLIEILVVVGIGATLLGIVIFGQREFSRRKVVDNAAAVVVSNLRKAQNSSTTGVKPSSCSGNYRLEGYKVLFNAATYSIVIECSDGSGTPLQSTEGIYSYPENVVATRFPTQPITFYSIGRGTDLSSNASVDLCAFGYGQRIIIDIKGNISNTEVSCS